MFDCKRVFDADEFLLSGFFICNRVVVVVAVVFLGGLIGIVKATVYKRVSEFFLIVLSEFFLFLPLFF